MNNEVANPQPFLFALVYENPNEFVYQDDDIHRELLGVYTTPQDAQQALNTIEDPTYYKIEVWENDPLPF